MTKDGIAQVENYYKQNSQEKPFRTEIQKYFETFPNNSNSRSCEKIEDTPILPERQSFKGQKEMASVTEFVNIIVLIVIFLKILNILKLSQIALIWRIFKLSMFF